MRRPLFAIILGWAFASYSHAQPLPAEEGNEELGRLAEAARLTSSKLDFEEFKAQTLFVAETGKFYVNGDTPIRNEKLLWEFWRLNVANQPEPADPNTPEFAVMNVGGLDQIWSDTWKRSLTYCVSTDFGGHYATVISDMSAAAAAWEAVADLDFQYISSEDANCDADNDNVLFDVRPVDAGGRFLAAAFFPNDPRSDRSVVIDPSSFGLDPNGALTLRGILRHELGHVLGGRHEHTRPEAGSCFEDNDWRGVTDYDAFSVMHYPQCNGLGDWSLRLTETDKSGVACIYGAVAGFVIDTDVCQPPGGAAQISIERHGPVALEADEMSNLGTFNVLPGTEFSAEMTGTGDPDLYVKIDGPVGIASYDCRPFTEGANEACVFDVPVNASIIAVMVHGFTASTALVEITRTVP